CRATCCATAMRSSAIPSGDRCETWVSTKCCAPRDLLAAGLHRARHWFDSARVPGPRARVRRKLSPSYPSFVFGLLSPIETASFPKQGLARTAIDPAGAHGESRGVAPGGWAEPPQRPPGSLRPCLSLI